MPQKLSPKNQSKKVMLPDDENLLEKKDNVELEEPTYTIAEGNLQRHHFASLGTKSKEKSGW